MKWNALTRTLKYGISKTKILTVVFLVSLATNVFAKEDNAMVAPLSQQINNKSLHEYSNIWWQWAKSMTSNNSAVVDKTGSKCGVNQEGNVWFLAGGYGSSKISRKCTIPKDTYIFFPVINMAYWPKNGAKVSCESVKADAALNNDKLLSIKVMLDGKDLSAYRLKSKDCFDLLGKIPKQHQAPRIYPSASDGYWVMLKPLTTGLHELRFKAQYNRESGAYGHMLQDIEYQLRVE